MSVDLADYRDRRIRGRAASDSVTDALEREVIAALLLDPSRVPYASEIVSPADFLSPHLGALFREISDLYRDGRPVSLPIIADELDMRGANQAIELASLVELTERCQPHLAAEHARRVRRLSLERSARLLHTRGAQQALSEREMHELVTIERLIFELSGDASGIDLGLTGEDLVEALRAALPPSPLPGLLDDGPSLHLLVGRPKIGKTTLGLHIAQSWACGVPPWPGAPALPGGRALIVSAEQSLRRVGATLSRLATWNAEHDRRDWTDRMEIVARDRALPREAGPLFCLDGPGQLLLRRHVERARALRAPFGIVLLDSLSRLKPREAEENDADAMTAFLDPLATLATELGVYVLLVHHEGHAERSSPVTAPRGSTSIAAVAQAVWKLELDGQRPNERVLTATGNAIESTRLALRVAPDEEPGKVLFFTPADPFAGADIDELLPFGEVASYTTIAERWLGSKSGPARTRAQHLVAHWRALGLVDRRQVRRTA